MAREQLQGFDRMLAALAAKGDQVEAATRDALLEVGHNVEKAVKTLLGRSSHPRGTPTPSPPGAPPSLITGNLRRSIQTGDARRVGRGHYSLTVSTSLVYSRIQELGGVAGHGSKLPPRPYMAPGLELGTATADAVFTQAWAGALEA